MERLQHLISKLNEQQQQKESPLQMLVTLKHIEAELTIMHTRGAGTRPNPGVSVLMPSVNIANRLPDKPAASATIPASIPVLTILPETEIKEMTPVQPAANVLTTPSMPPATNYRNGSIVNPANHTSPAAEALRKYQPLPAVSAPAPQAPAIVLQPVDAAPPVTVRREPVSVESEDSGVAQAWSVDPLLEVPTLSHQPGAPELNDIIGKRNPSINDRLKDTGMTEMGYQLKAAPVKELRKAIGVNDRYVFINELFRGDEAMYERSIKTINNFRILPEAQYWMERELKIKIGWDDSRDIVQHFYELVSRRFS